MSIDWFLEQIKSWFPADKAKAIISAFRQDEVVWKYLNEPSHQQSWLAYAGNTLEKWLPGRLAMHALKPTLADMDLRNLETPVPADLLNLAKSSLESINLTGLEPGSLSETGLLALMLREHRVHHGSWDGLLTNLLKTKNNLRTWKSAFVCLPALVPDYDLAADTLIYEAPSELNASIVEILTHAIFCMPISEQEQFQALSEQFSKANLGLQTQLLQSLKTHVDPSWIRLLASHFLAQLPDDLRNPTNGTSKGTANTDLGQVDAFQKIAQLSQWAGRRNEASGSIQKAFEALYQNQAESLSKLALQLETNDAEEARKTWEEVLRLAPANPEYRKMYAEFLISQDDLEHGEELLRGLDDQATEALFMLRYPELREGRPLEEETLRSALRKSPGEPGRSRFEDTPDTLRAARFAFDNKNYALADQFITKALGEIPNDLRAIKLAREIHKHLAEVDKAIEASSLLAIFEPDNQKNDRDLVALYLQTNQAQKAFETYQALINKMKEPSRKDLLTYAEIALKAGKPEVSISIGNNFLARDEMDGEALVLLCDALLASGQRETALERLETASALAPEKPASWLSLARIWTAFGDSDKALESLRKAKAALPDDAGILGALGKIYLDNDQPTEAIAVLKQACQQNPTDTSVRKSLASAYLAHGNLDEAWRVISPLEDEYSSDPDLALVLGRVLVELGDYQNAKKMLKFAWQSMHTEETLKHYALLVLQQAKGQQQLSKTDEKELNTILAALDTNTAGTEVNFDARVLKADINAALGNSESAYQDYLQLLDLPEAKSARNYHHLQLQTGKTAMAQGLGDVSLASLQEAILANPSDLETRHTLAEAYNQAGMKEESQSAAKSAFQLSPTDLDNILWYSQFAGKNGNPRDSVQVLQDAIHLRPQERALYLATAKAQVALGEKEKAKETLRDMLTLEQNEPEDFIDVANILLWLDEPDEANAVLKQAVTASSNPNFPVSRDLVYSVLKLNDRTAAANLVLELEKSFHDEAGFDVLNSDVLTADQKFLLARKTLEPLLHQLEFSKDNAALEELPLIDPDFAIPDYSRAGIYYRAAQLDRVMGDLNSAQKMADLAANSEPGKPEYSQLQLELAFATQNQQKIAARMDELYTPDSEKADSLGANELLALQALLEGSLNRASLFFEHFFSKNQPTPTSKAIEALVAFEQGRVSDAETHLAQAREFVEEQTTLAQASAFNIPAHFHTIWHALAGALAAWTMEKWEIADLCVHATTKFVKVNPVVNKFVAEYLADKTRAEKNAAMLRIVRHSPKPLEQNADETAIFEEQISLAGRFLGAEALMPVLKTGQAVYSGHWQDADNPRDLVRDSKQAAQVLSIRPQPAVAAQILSGFAEDGTVQFQSAVNSMQDRPEEARRIAANLVEKHPMNPSNHALMAFASQDHPEEAAVYLEKALSIWPDEPEWHAQAGLFNQLAGKFPEAAAHLEAALRLEPKNARYWQMLGDIKVLEKDLHAAKDYFAKATELFPQNPEALESLAIINQQLGEYQVAIQCLHEAARLEPDNPAYQESIAEIQLARQEFNQALEQADNVLKTRPNSARALEVRVKALLGKHQYEEARRGIQTARTVVQDKVPFDLLLIELETNYLKKNGLQAAENLAAEHPEDINVLNALAGYQVKANQLQAAEKTLQKSLRLAPEAPRTLLALGWVDRLNGNLDAAIAHLSQAIRLDPSLVEAYLEMGQTYQARREVPRAIEVYQRAIAMVPKDSRAYVQAAAAYKESKDYRNAEQMLRQASQISGGDASIRRQLAAVVALNLVNNLQEAPKHK